MARKKPAKKPKQRFPLPQKVGGPHKVKKKDKPKKVKITDENWLDYY